jgi:hypothetical protein
MRLRGRLEEPGCLGPYTLAKTLLVLALLLVLAGWGTQDVVYMGF